MRIGFPPLLFGVLAWTCKVSFARSSCREIQSIDILVPKIWYHVPTLERIKICPKRRLFNDKQDVFWMGFGVVCCGGRKRARPAARGSAAGERAHLNNLNGLIPPPGRRRLFWPVSVKGRRVSWTLFVNWFPTQFFGTNFGFIFGPGPR